METQRHAIAVFSFIRLLSPLLQAFEEDEADAEYREKEALALAMQEAAITDVKSFTQASSRAAVAATAAATAVAVTKACVFLVRHLRTSHRDKFDRSLFSAARNEGPLCTCLLHHVSFGCKLLR